MPDYGKKTNLLEQKFLFAEKVAPENDKYYLHSFSVLKKFPAKSFLENLQNKKNSCVNQLILLPLLLFRRFSLFEPTVSKWLFSFEFANVSVFPEIASETEALNSNRKNFEARTLPDFFLGIPLEGKIDIFDDGVLLSDLDSEKLGDFSQFSKKVSPEEEKLEINFVLSF